MAGEFPRRSRLGGPKGVPPRVPRAPRQLTERRQERRAGGRGRPRTTADDRGAARVPGQRAHAGRPRPASLRAPGDWRLDDEAEQGWGRYWPQSTITQQAREGRGLFREGHDCEAFSKPSDAIFSFLFFCLFTRFCSLLLTKLRVHDYRYSGYKSASYIWWRKAFCSCRPQLQIFQQGGSCPYVKEVFISRGPADSQAKPTEFSFALVGGPRQRYIRGRNFVSYKEIQSKGIASEPKILLKIKQSRRTGAWAVYTALEELSFPRR